MQHDTKRRPGRPPLSSDGSLQISIRFPQHIVDGIDKIISDRHGQGERTAIIRELVADALFQAERMARTRQLIEENAEKVKAYAKTYGVQADRKSNK